jgi:thiol-disulfide isomerase/thioredoxin
MNRWPRLLAPVIATVLALPACAGPDAPATSAGDRGAATEQADLAFSVATLDDATFEGASLAGKPAVLWFWAPWCPTCAAEAPHVRRIADQYDGRISVVGVAGLGEKAAMKRFIELTKVDSIIHLADVDGVVWRRFGVIAQSTYVLLDAAGTVVHRGYLDADDLDRMLTQLAG